MPALLISLVMTSFGAASALSMLRATPVGSTPTRGSTPIMAAVRRDYEIELAFATRVVREAGAHLLDVDPHQHASLALADAQQALTFEMSHEPAVSLGAKWLTHVDESIVSLALVDESGPVVGCVYRPLTNEVLAGAIDTGAYLQVGDGVPTPCSGTLGRASRWANVVHVPHTKCSEVEMALDALFERMPLNVTRVPCCCCCEGLFEVMRGRADVHLSPPEECFMGEQRTPVPVLCAFEVLLEESGGKMTDVHGNALDFAACRASGVHRGGILASEAAMHNYMLRACSKPFKEKPLTLPRLADALHTFKQGFRIETAEGGRHRVVSDSRSGFFRRARRSR